MWKTLKEIRRKLLELLTDCSKLQDIRSIHNSQLYFYVLPMKTEKITNFFIHDSIKILLRNKGLYYENYKTLEMES